jgi:hypothetical protein
MMKALIALRSVATAAARIEAESRSADFTPHARQTWRSGDEGMVKIQHDARWRSRQICVADVKIVGSVLLVLAMPEIDDNLLIRAALCLGI